MVLRDVVRNERIPRSASSALSIEARTNDVVVLPILLVLIAVANAEANGIAGWAAFAAQVFILGPAVGFAVGAGGAWLMGSADAKFGISREYQALYGIGLVLRAVTGVVAPSLSYCTVSPQPLSPPSTAVRSRGPRTRRSARAPPSGSLEEPPKRRPG